MISDRPSWCPDKKCEARCGALKDGAPSAMLCGGVTAKGARLCLRFDEPCGVQTLDEISAIELTDLKLLIGRIYPEQMP